MAVIPFDKPVSAKGTNEHAGDAPEVCEHQEVAHAHVRKRNQIGKHVFWQARNEEQDEHHNIELFGILEALELIHPFLGNHRANEWRAEFMHNRKNEGARNHGARNHNESADPWAIHHASRNLHDLARNERHHNLQKLEGEQNEHATDTSVAYIFKHALQTVGLGKLGNPWRDKHAHTRHEHKKQSQACQLENVGLGQTGKRRALRNGNLILFVEGFLFRFVFLTMLFALFLKLLALFLKLFFFQSNLAGHARRIHRHLVHLVSSKRLTQTH